MSVFYADELEQMRLASRVWTSVAELNYRFAHDTFNIDLAVGPILCMCIHTHTHSSTVAEMAGADRAEEMNQIDKHQKHPPPGC